LSIWLSGPIDRSHDASKSLTYPSDLSHQNRPSALKYDFPFESYPLSNVTLRSNHKARLPNDWTPGHLSREPIVEAEYELLGAATGCHLSDELFLQAKHWFRGRVGMRNYTGGWHTHCDKLPPGFVSDQTCLTGGSHF
jgi:hypothetical protein